MNRSILLVICDFFILTLLSFVQIDARTTEGAPSAAATTETQVSAPAMSNMVQTLAVALEMERQHREALTNALALTSAELERRLQLLAEREQNLTNMQERLAQTETEARRLAEERARLEAAQRDAVARVQSLQVAFETTRKGTENLQDKLTDSTREAAAAKARLEILEAELARRREEAQQMVQRMAKLDEATETLRAEKMQLAGELRQTEVEARVARSEVTNLNQRLTVVTTEKAQLAQTTALLATNTALLATNTALLATNITSVAERSAAIQEQIERQTRLPVNTIYGDFLSNRVETVMTATTRGVLGQEVIRSRDGATVFFKAGQAYYAVMHIDSIPLKIWPPDAPWTGFALELRRGQSRVAPTQFALMEQDPRIVVVPVSAAEAQSTGVRIYEAATDPSQFAEAVIVGAEERYYGETAYQLSARHPGYVEMERSTFRRILGDFAPRKGDLAFTRTGLLLGIMVNGDHCLLLNRIETLPAFKTGSSLNASQNSQVLRTAFGILEGQPGPLR